MQRGPGERQGRYSPAERIGARKQRIEGNPDRAHVSTSHVERHYLTMRMHMRRFTQLTNGFPKKFKNHMHMVALYTVWYNFVKTHKAHKLSPAMAAGVTDRLWSMEDLAAMIGATAPVTATSEDMQGGTDMTESMQTVPARKGRAVKLRAGQSIEIVNTHGQQVVDFWCFSRADPREFLSMEHLRPVLGRISPREGDALVTNRRRPILHFVEDTSPGVHDTLIAACDEHRYRQLGCEGHHDNCTENLFDAMQEIGIQPPECPAPLNLWMNIPVDAEGGIAFEESPARPGDRVVLRAEMDCIAVMSACPQDMVPINGKDCTPRDVHFRVIG